MIRTLLLLILPIAVILDAGSAVAQRQSKSTTHVGKSSGSSKPARIPHSSTPKSSSNTSKATSSTANSSTPTVGGSAQALEALEVERVTRLEQERVRADLKKDKAWYDDSLAEDLTSATSDGRLENKAQVIARCLDPADTLESETSDELSVRVYRDVAIATGRLSQKGKRNNAEYNVQRRFTNVWANRNGTWRQVAMHVSAIAGSEAASQPTTSAATQPPSTNSGAAPALQSSANATPSPQVKPNPNGSPPATP